MILILFNFFLFLALVFLHGYIFQTKIIKTNNKKNFYEICLIGLIITLISSQAINFFFPLNNYILYLNIIILLIYIFLTKENFIKNTKFDLYVFLICLLIIFLNIYGSGFSDDIDHYHYGFISNADNGNFIWGNSFLNLLYGTSPVWLSVQSYLNFDSSRLQDIHITNGLIFFLILGLFISEIRFKKNLFFYKPYLFLVLIFLLLKYTRLKEFGIDKPATILFCFMIYYYLKYFLNFDKDNLLPNFIILSLISISIILIKITYLPVLFLPLMILVKYRSKLIKKDIRYFFLLIPFLILIVKNILGTGCMIYPIESSCISHISWVNNSGARELSILAETFNKSWLNYKGDLSEINYIKNFNWLSTWFNRSKIEILEFTLTILLVIFITLISFKLNFKNYIINNKKLKLFFYFLIFLIITSVCFFFLKNPVLRMNHPTLISIMTLSLILFCESNLKKINNNVIYIFFVLAVLFNLIKNIDRIVDKNFVNNPYFETYSKISKPVKKDIDNFTYYIGWYGENPIGNRDLNNKNHKKILIFNIIN